MGYRYNPFTGELDRVDTTTTPTDKYPVTPYVVGPAGQAGYQTIQAACDAANSAGGGMVFIQPGTYTEDLTLYDGIALFGSSEQETIIVGTHTPPTSGNLNIFRVTFEDATAIFSSAAAGTTDIIVEDCTFAVTNGFTFDLLNWTGEIQLFDIGPGGINDGGVRNTGGATFAMFAAGLGNGTGQTMILSGPIFVLTSTFGCPMDFQTGATGSFNTTEFNGPLTFSNDSEITISGSTLSTGASAALTMSSSGNCSLINCGLTSTNDPCIDGAGAGTLTLTGVSFPDNSEIAGSLTIASGTTYSGTYKSDYTNHSVLISKGTTQDIIASNVGGNGQLLIAGTALDPAFASLTSAGGTITFTPGPNALNLEAAASVAITFDTDSGSATPVANTINFLGDATQGISSSGTGNTVTYTIADSTTAQKGVLETSTDAESIAGTATTVAVTPESLKAKLGSQTADGIPYGTGDTSALGWTAGLTDGQLVIGSTAGTPAGASLASSNSTITITPGSNSIDLSTGSSVAISFLADDTNSAVPSSGVLTVTGSGGITTSASGSTLTIEGSGEQVITITSLTDANSPYSVLSSDYYMSCDVSGGTITIDLPDAPTTGKVYIVKDSGGDANTNNITVTTSGGVVTIDGATSRVMSTNYEALQFVFNGTSYEVF